MEASPVTASAQAELMHWWSAQCIHLQAGSERWIHSPARWRLGVSCCRSPAVTKPRRSIAARWIGPINRAVRYNCSDLVRKLHASVAVRLIVLTVQNLHDPSPPQLRCLVCVVTVKAEVSTYPW